MFSRLDLGADLDLSAAIQALDAVRDPSWVEADDSWLQLMLPLCAPTGLSCPAHVVSEGSVDIRNESFARDLARKLGRC